MSRKEKSFIFSLKTRIIFFLGIAILLTIGISTLLYVKNFKENYIEAIEWRSVSLAQTIAVEMRSRYAGFDWYASPTGIKLLIESSYLQCKKLYDANRDNHITFIAILNEKGVVITHNDRTLIGQKIEKNDLLNKYLIPPATTQTVLIGNNYHTLIPVRADDGHTLATIDIGFPNTIVDQKVMEIITQALYFLLFIFFIKSLLFWLYLKHDIYRPISNLIKATDEISTGNLIYNIPASNTTEFQKLTLSLDRMRNAIHNNISQLENTNQEVKALVACSPVALFSINTEYNIAIWTTPAERLFGWSQNEVCQQDLPFLDSPEKSRFLSYCQEVQKGKTLQGKEFTLQRKDNTTFIGSLSMATIYDKDNLVTGIMISVEDISERINKEKLYHETEIQLQQAQKMESIGRLAGGVAHDYNNMLGVILGNAELTLLKMDQQDSRRRFLDEIITAAKHSADITSQLLAFARKQTITLETIDFNQCIENMLKMLRRLLGENIRLDWSTQTPQCWVKMDSTQVKQILANICINARDAMPNGGSITITTKTIFIDHSDTTNHQEFSPGQYICLTVRDTGVGMTKEVKEKVFEPFFTTKSVGEGTGLGLATVYGIVKQNNGFINVYSEPGHGTVFNIYISACQQPGEQETSLPARNTPPKTDATILVVEDEQAILDLCVQILTTFGYQVLKSSDPLKALDLIKTTHNHIDLLITDVIMPGMNGRELSLQLKQLQPHLKTLFMSGYTADIIAGVETSDQHNQFIQKPFSQSELTAKLKEILD